MAGALSLYSNVNILILAGRFIPLQTQKGREGGGGGQRQRTLNQGGAREAETRRGGQGHGGEVEETYLAFLNNTDACLLPPGWHFELGLSHLARSDLEAISVSRAGRKGRGPISPGG